MDGSWQLTMRNLVLLGLLSTALTGCTSVQSQPWSLFGNSVKDTAQDPASINPAESFSIQMYPVNGTPLEAKRALKPNMHIQEALTEVGGFKKFSRFNIELHRQMADGGLHRMMIDYAPSTRRIEPEFDYVLHPGDRIVVTERAETMLDDAMNAVLQPLGLERFQPHTQPKNVMPSHYRREG